MSSVITSYSIHYTKLYESVPFWTGSTQEQDGNRFYKWEQVVEYVERGRVSPVQIIDDNHPWRLRKLNPYCFPRSGEQLPLKRFPVRGLTGFLFIFSYNFV